VPGFGNGPRLPAVYHRPLPETAPDRTVRKFQTGRPLSPVLAEMQDGRTEAFIGLQQYVTYRLTRYLKISQRRLPGIQKAVDHLVFTIWERRMKYRTQEKLMDYVDRLFSWFEKMIRLRAGHEQQIRRVTIPSLTNLTWEGDQIMPDHRHTAETNDLIDKLLHVLPPGSRRLFQLLLQGYEFRHLPAELEMSAWESDRLYSAGLKALRQIFERANVQRLIKIEKIKF
jgi:hypothetical protein